MKEAVIKFLTPYWNFMDWLDVIAERKDVLMEEWLIQIISKLKWYWDKLTILSVWFIIICICLLWFIIQHSISHKKMMSRAFWRGVEYEKRNKENN